MPLYEFRCNDCGSFDEWRKMAESSHPAYCPTCTQPAKRLFSPPAVLSGSLRLKVENREPQLVKRSEQEPAAPKLRTHNGSRPWMISH
jgi:putative FmdB family regulatory protein